MEKLIITAAICGAEVTREHNPNLPLTAEELAVEAKKAEEAGASIIHLHVRDKEGKATQEQKTFAQAIKAMEQKGVTAIIQPSTGGAAGMSWQERIQPVYLEPEMATLDCGTTNFGEEIFVNDLPLMRNFAREMKKYGVMPELECFEIGHIYNALKLYREELVAGHLHFDLVLGVPGAMPGSIKNLLAMVDNLPEAATWTVAGIGPQELPLACHALVMGGHIRVGFEDNIFYRKGELAQSNAQLVARIVRLAEEVNRKVAEPEEAREILGLE